MNNWLLQIVELGLFGLGLYGLLRKKFPEWFTRGIHVEENKIRWLSIAMVALVPVVYVAKILIKALAPYYAWMGDGIEIICVALISIALAIVLRDPNLTNES